MKRNNDRMLLESLVRKYGKTSVVKAINEMNWNNNPIAKYVKFAEPLKRCFMMADGSTSVLPKSYKKDIERFLGKPFDKCLSFWEGNFGAENREAYEILYYLRDDNIIKEKSYEYLPDHEKEYETDYDYLTSFDVKFCEYNSFRFICQGGYGDDYCAII